MPEKKKKFIPILHPIQLISINIEELFIKVKKHPKSDDLTLDTEEFNIRTGHTEYDEKNHTIQVGLKLEITEKESPFDMRVIIGGVFKVDETKFAKTHIEDWANRNAPIILYPYLREQVYALTIRCGYPGLMIPLLTVPTIKVVASKKVVKAKVKLEK